ncbi:conserved exported hypothetical protein [Alphaproteobacteria bacterium]
MKKLFLLVFLIMGLTSKAYAAQKYKLNSETRVEASISSNEKNRIVIENDRISEVIGLSEDYVIETEDTQGQIFIKAQDNAKNPAIFSVITEKGKTQDFKLNIAPKAEGQVIIVKDENIELQSGKILGLKHIKHEEAIELIKQVLNSHDELKQDYFTSGSLGLKPLVVKKSGKYQVEVWSVKNQSNQNLQLNEKLFL